MWYTELALKSMNFDPYAPEISEDILSKFASLKSMLANQSLLLSLTTTIQRKELFSKSVALLAIKHNYLKQKSEQGITNPRFLLRSFVENFFMRSYASKRSKTLKDLFEFALKANNERNYNQSKLFALKYFSNSVNRTFLDFYKKLKDNKTEKLAQIKIMFSAFRLANKNKLARAFLKLTQHSEFAQGKMISNEKLKARLPKILVASQTLLISKAFTKLLGRKTINRVHEAASRNLNNFVQKRMFDAFSSIKAQSAQVRVNRDFEKTLVVYQLKYAANIKLQKVFSVFNLSKVSAPQPKSALISLYQLLYASKSKLLHGFQTLKYPNFKQHQITCGLEKLIGVNKNHSSILKQHFINKLCKGTNLASSRYHQLSKTLSKLYNDKMTRNLLALKCIENANIDRLFAANRIGKIQLKPLERNVASLILPCYAKLVNLLRKPECLDHHQNLILNFDRYIVIRSEFEKSRNSLAMQRAHIKFETQTIRAENQDLETRIKFTDLALKDLVDKNRKINLDISTESTASTRLIQSFSSTENDLSNLNTELQRLQNDKAHLKSEKKHLLDELRTANEEYNTKSQSRNFITIQDVETNVPNKSISQVNILPNGMPGPSIDRNDRDQFPKPNKYSVDNMSGDESMIKKYTIDAGVSRNNVKGGIQGIPKGGIESSYRRLFLRVYNDERTQLETQLGKLVEENDQIKAKLDQTEQERINNKEQFQSIEEKLVTKEMHLIDLQDKRGMVILEKTASRKNNEKVKKRLDDIKREIEVLELADNNNESSLADIESLRIEQTKTFDTLKMNATKIANLEKKVTEWAELQKEVSKEIAELKASKVELNKNTEFLTEQKKAIESEFSAKTSEIVEIKAKIANLANDQDDLESKRQILQLRSKRITLDSENFIISESIVNECKAQLKELEERLEKKEDEKGALMMQKLFMQKQRKKLFTQMQTVQAKLKLLENPETGAPDKESLIELNTATKERLLRQIEDLDTTIKGHDGKIAQLIIANDELKTEISVLKADLEHIEKNGPNETFLSKENLIMTFNPNHINNEKINANAFAQPNFQSRDSGNPFYPKMEHSFISGKDLKRHICEKIYEITQELNENANRLEKQKQVINEVQNTIHLKSREFDQLKLKSEFAGLKSMERENLIKSNCCMIVDFRDEQIINGKAIANNKQRIYANILRIRELDQKLREFNVMPEDSMRFIKTINTSVQTEARDPLIPISLPNDKCDVVHRTQMKIMFGPDLDILQNWLPKKHDFILTTPENYFVIRVNPNINSNSILAEIENNYSFDENGFKYIKKDTFKSNDDVEISGDYEDYFSQHSNEELDYAVNPESDGASNKYHGSYQFNHIQQEIEFQPKREQPMRPITKRAIKDFPMQDLCIFENLPDQPVRLQSKFVNLNRAVSKVFKSRLSDHFNDFKLISSKTQLKRFFTTLLNWKLATLDAKNEKLLEQAKRFKQSLFLLLHFAVQKREMQAFRSIALASSLERQKAFFKLLPVTIKANMAQRKNLKDILHYWYHIKDDNKWFGKTIKGMIFKSSLDPQIALWRLRLFRKKTNPISPQVTKGLLYLMDWYQDKELDNISRAFFKLSSDFTHNEFSSQPRSHISEYSDEQMSDYNSYDEDDFKNQIPSSQIQESEAELKEKQRVQMKIMKIFEMMVTKRKKLCYKYFHQLERRAMDPNIRKNEANSSKQALGYQLAKQKSQDENSKYLQHLQFVIEQNLKCKQELYHKDLQIGSLRTQLDQKQNDLLLLRNNFMFVFIEKIEKICSKHQISHVDRSLKLFFRKLK